MRSAIKSSIRQALASRGFSAALAGVVVVVLLSCTDAITEALRAEEELVFGWHGQQILACVTSKAFVITMPIWAALPYSASFVEDIKSGYIRFYLHRSTVNGYVFGRAAACMLSGALALTVGMLLSFFILCAAFAGREAAQTVPATPMLLQILARSGPVFLSGALWALTGMLISVLTHNKYMAYASPFIVYYLLIILHERYMPGYAILSPAQWLSPGEGWPLGVWGAVIVVTELILILLATLRIAGGRRLARI